VTAYCRLGTVSERQFLTPEARKRTAETIRGVELLTAVEVVVAVRRIALRHLGTSLAFGAFCALAGFTYMWLSPQVYALSTMPLDAALAFVLGTATAASLPWLRRTLTPRFRLVQAAQQGARRAFAELAIDRTRGRSGLLVYVALFERSVVIVPDSGVPEVLVQGPLASIQKELERAVRATDFPAFLAEIARLGPTCASVLPRQADDENELCDHVA
jgi:putative membrane protein